jgi:hypothetical protein
MWEAWETSGGGKLGRQCLPAAWDILGRRRGPLQASHALLLGKACGGEGWVPLSHLWGLLQRMAQSPCRGLPNQERSSRKELLEFLSTLTFSGSIAASYSC